MATAYSNFDEATKIVTITVQQTAATETDSTFESAFNTEIAAFNTLLKDGYELHEITPVPEQASSPWVILKKMIAFRTALRYFVIKYTGVDIYAD